MDTQVAVVAEDVQVAAKPQRRTYTAEYKRRLLKEADACRTPGAIGALLRHEGLYSSHLVVRRRARGRGELAGLAPKKRGRKATPVDPCDRKITKLEQQMAEMTGRTERAEPSWTPKRTWRRCSAGRGRPRSHTGGGEARRRSRRPRGSGARPGKP